MLAGDFNMPHVSWISLEQTTGANENSFVELLNDYSMVQLNDTPTRDNNVLDLVLTNIPELVKIMLLA